MKTEQYDVVIVGGGPAGSNAARLTKEYNDNLDVVVFERGEEPTANCAGGLGVPFKMHMGIEPPENIVESPIREVVLASPNEEMGLRLEDVDTSGINWVEGDLDNMGWVLDRQKWDNWQLQKAEDAGASVRRKHTVTSLEQNGKAELVVKDREENSEFKVKADFVGLANGPSWGLAKQAGFQEDEVVPPKREKHMGRQFHMKDPEYMENYGWDTIYLEFNRKYAPEGYVWSFPEGKEFTRWGNGIPISREENASNCMEQFLKDHDKWEMAEKTTRENTMAIIPTAEPLETAVKGNVALMGDTGHHCDPLHGGGMMFGSRAGKQFAVSVANGSLKEYDKKWKDDFLDTLQHRFVIRDLLYNMDNDDYDRFIKSIKGFEVQGLNPDKEIPRMMWHCLKNDPGIFGKSAKQATKSMARQKFGI